MTCLGYKGEPEPQTPSSQPRHSISHIWKMGPRDQKTSKLPSNSETLMHTHTLTLLLFNQIKYRTSPEPLQPAKACSVFQQPRQSFKRQKSSELWVLRIFKKLKKLGKVKREGLEWSSYLVPRSNLPCDFPRACSSGRYRFLVSGNLESRSYTVT